MRGFGLPWFGLLLVGGVLCVSLDLIFNLGEFGRIVVLAPFAAAAFAGMLYAGWIVLYYGVRADVKRMKEARAKGSSPP